MSKKHELRILLPLSHDEAEVVALLLADALRRHAHGKFFSKAQEEAVISALHGLRTAAHSGGKERV